MTTKWQRLYWAILIVLGLVVGYESLTRQLYGDNSLYWAVVFFGIAALSSVRLLSRQRGAIKRARPS